MRNYEMYKVNVPIGRSGSFTISKIDITQDRVKKLIPEGSYTYLNHKETDSLVMADTPLEIDSHWDAIEKAKGHVLIGGLGLGMYAQACLMNPEVKKVTVLEDSEDIIELVAPHYKGKYGDRFNVIKADAFNYEMPLSYYDVVWMDIWLSVSNHSWTDYEFLRSKYEPMAGWYGAWYEEEIEASQDKKRRE